MKRARSMATLFTKIFTISSLIFLSACGFSPVYGTGSQSSETKNIGANNEASIKANLNKIQINIIPNREGQYLRNALIDNFYFTGAPQNPSYTLRVNKINESRYDFDITQDSEATRRQIKLKTSYVLINNKNNKTLLARNITAYASYNVLESEFSTLVTEQNARDNTLDDLARQIERGITLYLNR